jgi:hypothetical protein
MRVIFLDFDGVLNSEQEVRYKHRYRHTGLKNRVRNALAAAWNKLCRPSFLRQRGYEGIMSINFYLYYLTDHCEFCPTACNNVQEILDEDREAFIVISSVWRSWPRPYLKAILKRNGIDPSRLLDITGDGMSLIGPNPHAYERKTRGAQIQEWLNQHPNVLDYVIIDDDSDMLIEQMPHFVQTSSQHGLMLKDAKRAMKILNPNYGDKGGYLF